jgi:hypothetical protein
MSLIQTIGFSLNSAIINYGLAIFDGGAGMQVFLFSSAFTFALWLIAFRLSNI